MCAPIDVAYSGLYGTDDHAECSSLRVSVVRSHSGPVDDRANIGQTVDAHFTGIPQGVIITDSYIRFQVDQVSTGTDLLTLPAGRTSDASIFTTAKSDRSAHARIQVFLSAFKSREVDLV